MSQLADLPRVWTHADLDGALPEDADWRRFEIVDGALLVTPSASRRHEIISTRLRLVIAPATPPGFDVIGPFGLDLAPSYRIPDLIVVPTVAVTGRPDLAVPDEALLVVEIESPSSRTTDRVTKPAEYATAGLRAYWRVESDPEVTLTAYHLPVGADTYVELGRWGPGETAVLAAPFPIRVPIDAIVP